MRPPPPPTPQEPGRPNAGPGSAGGMAGRAPPPPPASSGSGLPSALVPAVCLGGALLLCAAVGAAVFFRASQSGEQAPDSSTIAEARPTSIADPDSSDRLPLVSESIEPPSSLTPTETAPGAPAARASTPEATTVDAATSTAPATKKSRPPGVEGNGPSATSPSPDPSRLFADLERRRFELELPPIVAGAKTEDARLALVPVTAGQSLKLDVQEKGTPDFKLLAEPEADGGATWTVVKKARTAFGNTEEVVVGRFSHQDDELRFRWEPGVPLWSKPGTLQFTLLEVGVGTSRQLCRLWKPLMVNPVAISSKKETTVVVPLSAEMMDRQEEFQVEYQVAGISPAPATSAPAGFGKEGTVSLGMEKENGIELKCRMTASDGRSTLQVKVYGVPPAANGETSGRAKPQELTVQAVQARMRGNLGKDVLKKREVEFEKAQQVLGGYERQISDLGTRRSRASSAEQDSIDGQLRSVTQQKNRYETQVAKIEAELTTAREFAEKHKAWCEGALEILKNLETQGQLRYAVSIDAGQRIPVVVTTGFEWPAP